MKEPKASITDKLWAFRLKNMLYGEACFQLRMSASSGKAWRVNILIDELRKTKHDNVEDEIGLAMLGAVESHQETVIELMIQKKCGEKPYKKQEVKPCFCNPAKRRLYEKQKELSELYNKEIKQVKTKTKTPDNIRSENRLNQLTWQERAFCDAASNGDINIIILLLDHGIDLHILDDYAVCIAADGQEFEAFSFLIDQGADITVRNFEIFYSAIFYDSMLQSPEFLDKVLEQQVLIPHETIEDLIKTGLEMDIVKPEVIKKLLNYAEKIGGVDISSLIEKQQQKQTLEVLELLSNYKTFAKKVSHRKIGGHKK